MAGEKKISNLRARRRLRRKRNIRKNIRGSAARPRLSVFRSAKHIYVQAIDDDNNKVLASASDKSAALKGALDGKDKSEKAKIVGEALAKSLLEKNVNAAVFDRNGFVYHGRVKALADGARSAGLKF